MFVNCKVVDLKDYDVWLRPVWPKLVGLEACPFPGIRNRAGLVVRIPDI